MSSRYHLRQGFANGRIRSSSESQFSTARQEEQVYGERLLDDLINSFCDKLQKSAHERRRRFEGFLAIQYITLDVESVRKMITGRTRAMQIIYDEKRTHYIVLYLNSRKTVVVYDSMHSRDLDKMLTATVKQQILNMFGHLYAGGEVPVQVELDYERQDDDWSCGYRAIGCVTTLANFKNPTRHSFDLHAIYRLLISVLDAGSHTPFETFSVTTFSKTPPVKPPSRMWQLIRDSWSLTSFLMSKNGREADKPRVSLLLKPNLDYSVTEGQHLLKKESPKSTRSSRTDSAKTAISMSPSETAADWDSDSN